MSTIAGNEKENNPTTPPVSAEGGRKYNGCGWDGCYDDGGYDEEDMYYGRVNGHYENGIWYPPGYIKPKEPVEITYTPEELKSIKKQYSSESVIANYLSVKTEDTANLFKYIDYLDQEFTKLLKKYEDATTEVTRLRNIASYLIAINGKPLYICEYGSYEHGNSVYVTKHVPLRKGDLITGFNKNTQAAFTFLGGALVYEGLKSTDFTIYPTGVVCQRDGFYDIDIVLEYGKDIIRFHTASGEISRFEMARKEYNVASEALLKYMKRATSLRNKVSNIIDKGLSIDPENLSEILKRWQKLDRIVEYEIYEPYEKKVRRYGTSY